ncbi:MAG TPA: HD-GYP domain-containing protein [Candidatus Methylomirabilis sp.]|nr:HD-GYP domain-containing protein [Candidatus Methylomirabilis sp.]
MDSLIALDSLLRNLQAGVKSVGMYPPTHPTAARFLSRISEDLNALLGQQESLTLGVVDHALVAVGLPFTGTEAIAQAFAKRLEERGIGSIDFVRGFSPEEVSQCVQTLAMPPEALGRLGPVDEVLEKKGVRTIRLSSRVPTMGEDEQPEEKDKAKGDEEEIPGLGRGLVLYREAVGSVKRILADARMGKIPSLSEARLAVAGLVDGVLQHQNAMLALTLMKSYDEYLFNHSVNVSVLCIALGQALGLDPETIREMGLGALLHDVGKVHWPESLYLKPRGLSDEEWALVQRHPLDGAGIVEKMGNVSTTTMEVVLEHHLRFDRKGYPIVDPEKEPGFFGMIAQIADAYDAITTSRVYQNAFEPSRAMARLQSLAGTVFDPKLLETFVRMVGIYPVGSLVRLSTGELALVVKANPTDSSRPFVRLLFDRTGRRLVEEKEVDLTEQDPASGLFRRNIIMAVDPISKNFDVAKYLQQRGEVAVTSSTA